MKKYIFLLVIATLSLSCNNRKSDNQLKDNSLEFAKGINISEEDGYYRVEVKNPWKEDALLQTYILIGRRDTIPDNIPKGTIIRTPLKRAIVYSSVHAAAIAEITGNFSSIAGVCDSQYFNLPEIKELVSQGKVIDCGSSIAPTIEKIVETQPDAILLSPFQNAGYGALSSLKVPIIECADYMETSPLGRAEWIKFIGLLYNKEEKSNSIFNDTRDKYLALQELTKDVTAKPKIITETVMNGIWYVPGGNSYMAQIIADAGGAYPWSDDKSTGSLQFDFAQVFDKAHDADIWLIKTYGQEVTHKSLQEAYTLNSNMDAFKKDGIYACDTKATTLFEDFPFHPDILIKEYISIFHPELLTDYSSKYFKQVIK